MNRFSKIIQKLLRHNVLFHLKENPAYDIKSVINLIDRFLDDNLNYEMEWDDFISWKNENYNIEVIRNHIGKHEKLLFSKNLSDRAKYIDLLIEERNKICRLAGLPERSR